VCANSCRVSRSAVVGLFCSFVLEFVGVCGFWYATSSEARAIVLFCRLSAEESRFIRGFFVGCGVFVGEGVAVVCLRAVLIRSAWTATLGIFEISVLILFIWLLLCTCLW